MEIISKNIFITGGATRIGKAITMELLKCGANVYCHYHTSEDEAAQIKKYASKSNKQLSLFQADLSSIKNVIGLVDKVLSEAGHIDILINNAAIFFKSPLGNIKEEEWDALFSINLKTPFFISQKIGLNMKKRGVGKIINIGDSSGLNIWAEYLPYALTKSGVIAMTKGLAKALAPEVLVNCINPGPVLLPDYYNKSDKEKSIKRTLLKRTGSADDIVKTVKFLIEGSDYLTGSVINVDGGRSIN